MRELFVEKVINTVEDFLDNNQRIKLKEILTEICLNYQIEIIEQTKRKETQKNNTDILDMRKLSIVNGLTPPIDGEKLEYKRCYMLRFSTLKKLEQIKAMHPDIIYISSIVDMAINHYFHCLFDNE